MSVCGKQKAGALVLGLVAVMIGGGDPDPLAGQVASTSTGFVLGAGAGALVSVAWVTADASRDQYLFSPKDALPRLIPVPLTAVAGGLLGYYGSDRLGRSVGFGAMGFAAGAGVGALGAKLAGVDTEGVWSGAVIGGATGLLVGAIFGASSCGCAPGSDPPMFLSFSFSR